MTTLPQTAGARFPRAGVRSPAIPALAHAGAAGPAGGGGNALGVADVLRVLRANLLQIIVCVTLALIGGYLVNDYVFMKYMQRYTARAVLQVQTPSMIDPSASGSAISLERTVLEVRQKTLAQKLMSPDLWRPILQNDKSPAANSAWMSSFRTPGGALDQGKAIDAIASGLRVNPNPQTELISVELSAPTPADAKVILQAVVERLIQTEQENLKTSTSEDRQTLSSLLNSLNQQILGLDAQINASQTLLNSNRDGAGNGMGMARQMELQVQIGERIKKDSIYTELNTQYQQLAQALDSGVSSPMVDGMIEQAPAMQRLNDQMDNAETNVAATRNQYGDSHRQTASAQAYLDALKAQAEQKRATLRVSMGAQVRDQMGRQTSNAKAELDAVNAQITRLEQQLGEINIEQSKLAQNMTARDYALGRRKQIDDRIQTLDANANRQSEGRGTVRLWGSTIDEPKSMSFPDRKMTLAAAGLMGLGLSLGIAFLREMMDTSVRSPRDIMKVGQLNLLGMIPHTDDDPQAAAGEVGLIISQEPHSIIAENFRQVRTRLQHTASLDTTRSMLVTSPGPGDGKTTVACNIAAGLALNGRKILLVDANFRRPDLHRIFGLTNESGFGSVLSQANSAESVIKKTSVPNLDVLTTGPRPANTTELLESQLLTDFIDRTLEEYDHVIFDAGPILLVSETVALAPRVDGVISVVRARANSRGLLMRMRDALRQLKAEHLGVVLNGVRQHSGGYYARNIKNYYAYQNGKN